MLFIMWPVIWQTSVLTHAAVGMDLASIISHRSVDRGLPGNFVQSGLFGLDKMMMYDRRAV